MPCALHGPHDCSRCPKIKIPGRCYLVAKEFSWLPNSCQATCSHCRDFWGCMSALTPLLLHDAASKSLLTFASYIYSYLLVELMLKTSCIPNQCWVFYLARVLPAQTSDLILADLQEMNIFILGMAPGKSHVQRFTEPALLLTLVYTWDCLRHQADMFMGFGEKEVYS